MPTQQDSSSSLGACLRGTVAGSATAQPMMHCRSSQYSDTWADLMRNQNGWRKRTELGWKAEKKYWRDKPDKQQKWAEKPGQWELYKPAQGGQRAAENRVEWERESLDASLQLSTAFWFAKSHCPSVEKSFYKALAKCPVLSQC